MNANDEPTIDLARNHDLSAEQWAALGENMKRESHAKMATQRKSKPLPPDLYPVVVWDIRGTGAETTEVFLMVARGAACGRYLSDIFDRREEKDNRRFAALLRAAGRSADARPDELEERELLALVRCVAGRTRNAVTDYKRDPRA